MNVTRVRSDLLGSNMYIAEENGCGIVIDPCRDLSEMKENVRYEMILLTHEHFDHISGVSLWREKTGAKVVCTEKCGENIKSPVRNVSRYFTAFCKMQTFTEQKEPVSCEEYSCTADICFSGIKEILWQGHSIELIECTGHSPGGMLILIDRSLLFSGDTVLDVFPTENRMSGSSGQIRGIQPAGIVSELKGRLTVFPGHFDSFKL